MAVLAIMRNSFRVVDCRMVAETVELNIMLWAISPAYQIVVQIIVAGIKR